MIGLPAWNDSLTEYNQCIDAVERQVMKFTAEELEQLNTTNRQAGVKAYKREELVQTDYVGCNIAATSGRYKQSH